MEEVEVVTGGMPAEVGIATGGFVNAVTRSGGNKFSGLLQAFYNREPWSTIVVPEDQLTAMGLGLPTVAVYSYDLTGSFGGPIIKDKVWFFSNGRYGASETRSGFVPWTSPLGVAYTDFNREDWSWGAMGKLTFQPTKNLRLPPTATTAPPTPTPGPAASTCRLTAPIPTARGRTPTSSASATYILNQDTFLEARRRLSRSVGHAPPPEPVPVRRGLDELRPAQLRPVHELLVRHGRPDERMDRPADDASLAPPDPLPGQLPRRRS